MKKLKISLLALAGCLGLNSCSSDDDGTSLSTDLTGTFQLTSFVVPVAQDLDDDGDSSTNLVNETGCYADSQIIFHSDGTYEETYNSSILAAGGLTLTCDSQTTTGTYTQNGNTVTTTSSTGVTAQYTFNSSAETLTQNQVGGQYPGFNLDTLLMLTGNLTVTFTKISESENGSGNNEDLIGNYDLTAFVVPLAQDLDNDADESTNLVTESSCYGESEIMFHSDGTYDQNYTYSMLSSGGLSLECQTETTSGTWTRNGNTVTTTTSGSASVSTQYSFNSTTHTLMQTISDGTYPGFNTATEVLVSLTGNLNLTYTRQ